MSDQTCYYCGCPATTKEHVPPKCLFPEQRDAFGADYRMNLITIPSCDKHNLEKSKDDEFLMSCLTPVVGNSGLGYIQTQTKLARALQRNDGRLLNATLHDRRNAKLVTPDGAEFPILVGRPDMPRLCSALEHVARGLYFHRTGKRFIGKCVILPAFVYFAGDPNLELIKQLSRGMVNQEKPDWLTCGDNPAVFQYQMGPPDQFGLIPMLMTFFRGSEVFASFQPKGVMLPFRTLDEPTPDNPIVIDITLKGEGST